jgi:hypothetical protein
LWRYWEDGGEYEYMDIHPDRVATAIEFGVGYKGGKVVYVNTELSPNYEAGGLQKAFVNAILDPLLFKDDDMFEIKDVMGGEFYDGPPVLPESVVQNVYAGHGGRYRDLRPEVEYPVLQEGRRKRYYSRQRRRGFTQGHLFSQGYNFHGCIGSEKRQKHENIRGRRFHNRERVVRQSRQQNRNTDLLRGRNSMGRARQREVVYTFDERVSP